MQEINVEVRPDFLEWQAKAPPVEALAELIWNALDFEHDALGGMSKIVVSDNGHGMPLAEARQLFKNFGGSWKRSRASTQGLKRILHGREGRGRFKAFALGGVVDWKVIYNKDGSQFRYDISVLESEIARVRISDEQPAAGLSDGVIVVISELKRQFSSLRPENAVQELSEIFAIYLKDYRDVSITIGDERIDPNLAIAGTWEFNLTPVKNEQEQQHPIALEVIEWRRQTRRTLYLCNERGSPALPSRNSLPRGGFPLFCILEI
jgi:Histidine kinase-, DNA gyrase B-, and HSP90-like ATPase